MQNRNSLENLKKPKKKKEYGYRYQVPTETIDTLFKHLAEGLSLREAAKEVDVCYDTAKKYFDKGDDRRGIRPIKMRLQIFQDSVSKEFNADLIERRKELLKLVRTSIDQITEEIDSGSVRKKASYSQLKQMIELEIKLLGGEVEKREKTIGLLTAEDIRGASEIT